MMVGRLLSSWDGIILGAMLHFQKHLSPNWIDVDFGTNMILQFAFPRHQCLSLCFQRFLPAEFAAVWLGRTPENSGFVTNMSATLQGGKLPMPNVSSCFYSWNWKNMAKQIQLLVILLRLVPCVFCFCSAEVFLLTFLTNGTLKSCAWRSSGLSNRKCQKPRTTLPFCGRRVILIYPNCSTEKIVGGLKLFTKRATLNVCFPCCKSEVA